MARKGRTANIGKSTQVEGDKDFAGAGVEGQKSTPLSESDRLAAEPPAPSPPAPLPEGEGSQAREESQVVRGEDVLKHLRRGVQN